MYVSMSRLRVPAERAEALVRAFRARVGLGSRRRVLELAADTVEAELQDAGALAGRLRDAAAHVRGAESFLL
jgi:hypothetical protein